MKCKWVLLCILRVTTLSQLCNDIIDWTLSCSSPGSRLSGWRGHLSPRPQYTFTFTLQSSEICGDKKYSSFPDPCVSTRVVTLTIAMCGSDNWVQIILSKSWANTRMLWREGEICRENIDKYLCCKLAPREFNILDSWDVFLRHVEWMTRIFVIPNFSLSKYCSLLKWGNILPYFVFSTNTRGLQKKIHQNIHPFSSAWWVYPIFSIEYNQIDPIIRNNIISPLQSWLLMTWSTCCDSIAQTVIGHDFRFSEHHQESYQIG